MAADSSAKEVSSHPLALAHAVAALQSYGRAVQPMSASATPPFRAETRSQTSCTIPAQQCAGMTAANPGGRSSYSTPSPSGALENLPDVASVPGNDTSGDNDDNSERRLARSRERNREHARKTRLRKKAQLESLQSKVKGLEAERQILKQNLEECGIASILLGLSTAGQASPAPAPSLGPEDPKFLVASTTGGSSSTIDPKSAKVALLAGGKRKRFLQEDVSEKVSHPLKLELDGQTTLIGGENTHINWKTGVYSDEHGVQKQLTTEQLECLRRERNRMHAKMTRDRKKCFISAIEKTIDELEADIRRMKDLLAKVASAKFSQMVTPIASPELVPVPSVTTSLDKDDTNYDDDEDDSSSKYSQIADDSDRSEKRPAPGFSLDS